VPTPTLNGKVLYQLSSSPNGKLFLGRLNEVAGQNDHFVLVDRQGHLMAELPGGKSVYLWSTDSSALCGMHDPGGNQRRLVVWSLSAGSEHVIHTFNSGPDLQIHGVVACALNRNRIIVETLSDSIPGAANNIFSLDASGRIVASRTVGSPAHPDRLLVAGDGGAYAENPVHQAEPAIIRDTDSGRQLVTLPGRHVRAFDGTDDACVTTDAPADNEKSEPKVSIQIQQLQGGLLWRTEGYYRGATVWTGHQTVSIGYADDPGPTRNGYRIVAVDASGAARIIEPKGFFA
jgi:hypothetical protein